MNLQASIKINAYKIIDDVIDRAVRYGYRRACKYVDCPTEDQLTDEIHRAVMNELCEVLKFDEDE